jgi:hypothetical protein
VKPNAVKVFFSLPFLFRMIFPGGGCLFSETVSGPAEVRVQETTDNCFIRLVVHCGPITNRVASCLLRAILGRARWLTTRP